MVQLLAAGFIPINTWQQRASLPFKPGPGYLELCSVNVCAGKEGIQQSQYNICFHVLTFAKPSFDNVLQPSWHGGLGLNTLSHSGLASVNTPKRKFYLLNDTWSFFKYIHEGPKPLVTCMLLSGERLK